MVSILSGRVLNQGLARLHRLPSVVRPPLHRSL